MSPLPRTRLLAYGGLGLPLAFAALPHIGQRITNVCVVGFDGCREP